MSVSSFDQLNLSKYYTYQDYMKWTFPERVELLSGKVFKMSPAPNVNHQLISGRFFKNIAIHLEGSKCFVISAPFDVRLPVSLKKGKSDTVVQPDIVVICDQLKLDEQGCNGAPDLVVEILSPGNSKREMKDKFELYEASKVQEYWIVDPIRCTVIVYTLRHDVYVGSKPFVEGAQVLSEVLPKLELEVEDVFRE